MKNFIIGLISGMLIMSIVLGLAVRHISTPRTNPSRDSLYKLVKHPKIDSTDLRLDLSLRRVSTLIKTQDIEIQYFEAVNLYYKTSKEKYRIRANRLREDYVKSFKLYQSQDDSLHLLHSVKQDSISGLPNGEIPEGNLEDTAKDGGK